VTARLCHCGCGRPVMRDPRAIYATAGCKNRAASRRRRVSRLTAIETRTAQLPPMRPSTRRILKALLAVGGAGATTRELAQPDVGGIRLSARVFELRELGFRIEVRQERPGSHRYTLLSGGAVERLFDPEGAAA